ncbi:MAG: OmpA family protein [Gammaproteobacteria bacterium]|jgi:OOP family OmpA-OmpF porin|nr:OmpA family protein [Gammaproteobacteria bacterium]
MKAFKRAAVATLAGLFAVTAVAADDNEKKFYVDLLGSFADFDSERSVKDGFAGGSLRFGTVLNDRWNFEISGTALNADGTEGFMNRGSDLDYFSLGANALAVFDRGSRIQPFLLGGLGMSEAEYKNTGPMGMPSFNAGLNDTSPFVQGGVGVFVPFFNNAVRIRAEGVYRYTDDDFNSDELLFNVGVSIPFGKEKAAPVAAVAAAAVVVVDTDGDGVPDAADQCPNTPAGATVDARGCELDSDGDGIVDRLDECPNTPAGTKVDGKGCAIITIINLEGVNFQTNSAALIGGADDLLNEQAATLKENPNITIEVAGHTDSSGDAGYNMDLSQKRAETVRDYLISRGVDADRITARGYGETQPIADNTSRTGMAANRRVELRIKNK